MTFASRLAPILAAFAVFAGGKILATGGVRATSAGTGGALPPSPRFERPAVALFADDFSTDGLSGWSADRQGVWSVEDGVLRASLPDAKQEKSFLRAGGAGWTDYAVDVDVCMTRGVDKGVAIRVQDDQGIAVDLRGPGYGDVLLHRGMSRLSRAEIRNPNRVWHHIRLEARGRLYRVFVNGRKRIEAEDDDRRHGGIALAAFTGGSGKCTVYYDNVVVTPLGANP